MEKDDISKLIEELYEADQGSEELDAKVINAFYPFPNTFRPLMGLTPTRSIDAALIHIPEGSVYNLVNDWASYNKATITTIGSCETCGSSHGKAEGIGESMPLAICIAVLKIKEKV